MLISSGAEAPRPAVHGHRGCRGLRPENTLPAFLHATALGVDALELDVVVSADGQVVVSHEPWMSATICLDPAGRRIAPAEEARHNLYQLPYATIRRYDCGQLPHPSFPEQQSVSAYKPVLREVVAQVDALTTHLGRPPMQFSIEVKSTPAGDGLWHPPPAVFTGLVLAEMQLLNLVSRTTLLSFDERLLREVRAQLPGVPLCLLVENTRPPLRQQLATLGFIPAVYGPHYGLVTEALVKETRRLGLQLVPWTVNDLPTMRRLIELGVTGLTTDYPDRLLGVLSSSK